MPKSSISNARRRGAVYWWRRLIAVCPLAFGGNRTISCELSLRTREPGSARGRAAALTAYSERLKMSLRDLVANSGLTDDMCGAIFQTEMRSYRDELVHLEAGWKIRPDWAAITDRDSDLAVYEGVWSGVSTDGLGAPRNAEFVGKHFAERSEEEQDRIRWLLRDQHGLSDALRSDAEKRLEERGVMANAVSLPVVVDTLARARAEATRRVRTGELATAPLSTGQE